jgi:YhcH/YjgK/YiaL family protein
MKRLNKEDLKTAYPVAYEFLSTHDMVSLEEKRYELGNKAYVNVEAYGTYKFNERRYESHIKYVDIQCIIVGRENIIVEPVIFLSVVEEYNPKRDITFYKNDIHGFDNIMEAGDMLLLEPTDGHMPCVAIEESVYVKKAVFKFPVE